MEKYDIYALPGSDNTESIALGLSSKGHVAGYAYEPQVGAIWYEGSLDLPLPANSQSSFDDVNSLGEAVGGRGEDDPATQIPVLVRAGEVQNLSFAVGIGSIATGINDSGQVCGYNKNAHKAFIYDSYAGEVISWIDPLTDMSSPAAIAINTHGHVVGNFHSDHSLPSGFFYDGTLKHLQAGKVHNLNDSKIACGKKYASPWHESKPATWDARQAEPEAKEIPLPPGFIGGEFSGINNHVDLVGCCWTGPEQQQMSAFIRRGGESVDLNKLISNPDWHLDCALRINDNLQITGWGQYKGQQPMAFLLEPQLQLPTLPFIDLPVSFDIVIGEVLVGGGRGWIISLKGGQPPRPAPPPPQSWLQLNAAKREALMGLVLDELAMYVPDRGTREKMRTELLEGVQTSLDRLMKSIAESHTPPGGAVERAEPTPAKKAQVDEILARHFGFRSNR
jgi:hypothetical protein